MVKPAQNRGRDNALAIGQVMAARRHRAIRRRLRNSWSQAAMWAAAIVVLDPSGQDLAQMGFGERNEKVQTLAPNGAYQPFTEWRLPAAVVRQNRGGRLPTTNPRRL